MSLNLIDNLEFVKIKKIGVIPLHHFVTSLLFRVSYKVKLLLYFNCKLRLRNRIAKTVGILLNMAFRFL